MIDDKHIASARSIVEYLFTLALKPMIETSEQDTFQAEICASFLPKPLANKIAHSESVQSLVTLLADKLDNTKVHSKAVHDAVKIYEKNTKMLGMPNVG